MDSSLSREDAGQSTTDGFQALAMLNLVMLSPSFMCREVCGISDYTGKLCHNLSRNGYRITIVSDRESSKAEIGRREKQDITPIPYFSRHNLRELRSISKVWAKQKPSLFHIQYQNLLYSENIAIFLLPAILSLTQPKLPIAITLHDLIMPRIFPKAGPLRYWLLRIFLKYADVIFVSNHASQAEVLQYGIALSSIRVVPNGPTIEKIALENTTLDDIARRYGIRREKYIFTYFGTVMRDKCFDLLLRAVCLLPRAVKDQCQFLIVGGVPDYQKADRDNYGVELARLAKELGIGEQIQITGFVPEKEVSGLFQLTDALVQPKEGRVGPLHTTTASAIVHNVPIIAVGDSSKLDPMIPSEMVIWANSHEASLSEKLERVVTDSHWNAKAKTAMGTVAARFSWAAIAKQHHEAYSTLLEE